MVPIAGAESLDVDGAPDVHDPAARRRMTVPNEARAVVTEDGHHAGTPHRETFEQDEQRVEQPALGPERDRGGGGG